MLELLKDRTYIRYWLAVVASFLGDAITKITLIYVVATETDDPVLYVSLVVIAQLLPFGVLGAFVGPLADRLPARLLMVGSDLVRVVLVLAMIVVRDSRCCCSSSSCSAASPRPSSRRPASPRSR